MSSASKYLAENCSRSLIRVFTFKDMPVFGLFLKIQTSWQASVSSNVHLFWIKFWERTGAYKVSNWPVTIFSITSSPIIYRATALAYVTILTSKLLAFHSALTDFTKRQKLHFCIKNFKNDFSFPDVFVCNIATTPSSSSYQLIQLFKYYKTMPFSKIRNTGHCPNHKEKHSKRPMLYIFSHCLAIFDSENWNDPFFWFFSFDRVFQILQNYIVSEGYKYWPLCQPLRKPFKNTRVLRLFSLFGDFWLWKLEWPIFLVFFIR